MAGERAGRPVEGDATQTPPIAQVAAAVITTTAGFEVTGWDRTAERIYGWPAAEAIGRPILQLIRSDLEDTTRRAVRQATAQDGSSRLTARCYRTDGTPIDVEVINLALRDQIGRLTGYLAIHRDVTPRGPPADLAAVAQLTPRELEVLQALADGFGTQEIADRLHISIATERNHMTNILAKLGVHSQLQAVLLAARCDAVDIPRNGF